VPALEGRDRKATGFPAAGRAETLLTERGEGGAELAARKLAAHQRPDHLSTKDRHRLSAVLRLELVCHRVLLSAHRGETDMPECRPAGERSWMVDGGRLVSSLSRPHRARAAPANAWTTTWPWPGAKAASLLAARAATSRSAPAWVTGPTVSGQSRPSRTASAQRRNELQVAAAEAPRSEEHTSELQSR